MCSACTSLFSEGEQILDARVISLGGDATQNALRKFGLTFDNLNILSEHGLIIADYRSWHDFGICVAFGINEKEEQVVVRVPFGFEGRYWVLRSKKPRKIGSEYRVSGIALTKSGGELPKGCRKVSQSLDTAKTWQRSSLRQDSVMTEVDSVVPQVRNTDLSWTQAE